MKIMQENPIVHDKARTFQFTLGKRGYIIVVSLDWLEDAYLARPVFHMSRSFFGIGVYRLAFFVSVMRFRILVEP